MTFRSNRAAIAACLLGAALSGTAVAQADKNAAGKAKRPGPAIYRYTQQAFTDTVTDPCGTFSMGLGGVRKNCTPVTRKVMRSERRRVYYDVYGHVGAEPDWIVDRTDEIIPDPTTTVAPLHGLYEMTTTMGYDAGNTRVERICIDTMKAIEALFQAHRGTCGPPTVRRVTSENVYIAGRCEGSSARLEGRYDAESFALQTMSVKGGSLAKTVVTGRRLSPSCAAPAEPRW